MNAPITATNLLLLHLFSPCTHLVSNQMKSIRQREREIIIGDAVSQRDNRGTMNLNSLAGMQNPGSDSDGAEQVHDQRIVVPNKFITEADCINRKDQAW